MNNIARAINEYLTLATTGANPLEAPRFYISHLTPDNVNLVSAINCKRLILESDLEYEDVAASSAVTASLATTVSPASIVEITSSTSLASVSPDINMELDHDNDLENDDPVQQFVNNIRYEKVAMCLKLLDAFTSLDNWLDTTQLTEITRTNAITAIAEDIIRCDRMENDTTTFPNLLRYLAYIRIYQIMQRFRITVTAYLCARYPNQTISPDLFENKRQVLYHQIMQAQRMQGLLRLFGLIALLLPFPTPSFLATADYTEYQEFLQSCADNRLLQALKDHGLHLPLAVDDVRVVQFNAVLFHF